MSDLKKRSNSCFIIFSSLNGLHEIEVSTVDGFQGREKHVIIMSCVRAKSSSGTIG